MQERALLITIICVLAVATSVLALLNMKRSPEKEPSYLEEGYSQDE